MRSKLGTDCTVDLVEVGVKADTGSDNVEDDVLWLGNGHDLEDFVEDTFFKGMCFEEPETNLKMVDEGVYCVSFEMEKLLDPRNREASKVRGPHS